MEQQTATNSTIQPTTQPNNKPILDFLSIGDTTLDTFLQISEKDAQVFCNLNREECRLCIHYADKIPVEELHTTVAGNAANVAVTAARLQLKAAIWTIMGQDEVGQRAHQTFEQEKISLDYFQILAGTKSNLSTVINVYGERTILVYHHPRLYVLPKFQPVKWVYLTSMAQGSEVIFGDLTQYVVDTKARLVFQPGTFQLRLGADRAHELLEVTEILVLNKKEAQAYTGQDTDSIRQLAHSLHRLGPKIVVITDGRNGAYASNGQDIWFLGIIKDIPRREATGAGDAFASAFTVAICHGKNIPEAMRWGLFNASGVIQKVGPQAGVLTLDQMYQWEQKYQHLVAEKVK